MRAAPLMLLAALTTATSVASAQKWALRPVRDWGAWGMTGSIAIPVGEFAQHAGAGGGVSSFVTINVDPLGVTALRIDGSVLAYGRAVELSSYSYPYYYPVGSTTTSFVAGLRAGPQLTFGRGPARLYGFGQAGFSYFATTTSYGDCSCSYDDVTEFDDFTWSWETGGGMLIRLGDSRVLLDLGARYMHNGRAEYLPARFAADPSAQPIESEANLVALHLGLTFGLR